MADIVPVRRPLNRRGATECASPYLETRRTDLADPWDLVLDPNLTSDEKMEILSDWASAARAMDSRPDEDGAAGTEAWWYDLAEGLRLVEAEIEALSEPAKRPGHLRSHARRAG